jgi:hypothetical protein
MYAGNNWSFSINLKIHVYILYTSYNEEILIYLSFVSCKIQNKIIFCISLSFKIKPNHKFFLALNLFLINKNILI